MPENTPARNLKNIKTQIESLKKRLNSIEKVLNLQEGILDLLEDESRSLLNEALSEVPSPEEIMKKALPSAKLQKRLFKSK